MIKVRLIPNNKVGCVPNFTHDPFENKTHKVIYKDKNKATQCLTLRQLTDHLSKHGGHIKANKGFIKWEDLTQ